MRPESKPTPAARDGVRWRRLAAVVCALTLPLASAGRARAETGAEQLIKLKKAGLDEFMLIQYIQHKLADYRPSADEIVKLKDGGFSNKVVSAFITGGQSAPQTGGQAPLDPPPPSRPPPASRPVAPTPGPPLQGGGVGRGRPLDPKVVSEEPVEILPGKKVEARFPYNKVRPGQFLIFSTQQPLPPSLTRPVRGKTPKQRANERQRLDFLAYFKGWRDYCDGLSAQIGVKMHHSLTEHCSLHWTTRYDKNQLQAKHLERLILRLDTVFGPNVFRFTKPKNARFFVFGRTLEYSKYLHNEAQAGRISPSILPMLSEVTALQGANEAVIDAERIVGRRSELPRTLIHAYGHMLIIGVGRKMISMPAWLKEGFAAYCEILQLSNKPSRHEFNKSQIHCTNYELNDQKFELNWPPQLVKAIQRRRDTPLGSLFGRPLHTMTPIEHYQSRALVHFMVHGRKDYPRRFLKFLSVLKSGKRDSVAILEAYGLDLPRFTTTWKKYVFAVVK